MFKKFTARRMLSLSILGITLQCLSAPARAELAQGGDDLRFNCFTRHLSEAISLNQARKPLYSELSQKESEAISNKLIFFERLAYLPAKWIDWQAKPYQQAGIGIACDEFMPMKAAPALRNAILSFGVPNAVLHKVDTSVINQQIRKSYKENGFEGVSHFVKGTLDDLNQKSPYGCMLKHILASILRTANLAPKHEAAAQVAKLPSPRFLSWNLIRLHLFTLSSGAKLDDEAFPLHVKGIPIICQDVPEIPSY